MIRSLARAALAATISLMPFGCTGESVGTQEPNLIPPGGPLDKQSLTLSDTKTGQPYLFGNISVCLDGPGAASIESVAPIKPKGRFQIQAFTLRPFNKPMKGNGIGWGEPATIEGRELINNRRVSQACPPESALDEGASSEVTFSELVFQVSRPYAQTASTEGLLIMYKTGRINKELRIDFGIVLCGPNERSIPNCLVG